MVSLYLPKSIYFTSIYGIFGLWAASFFSASVFCLRRQKQRQTSGFNTAPADLSALDKVSAYPLGLATQQSVLTDCIISWDIYTPLAAIHKVKQISAL